MKYSEKKYQRKKAWILSDRKLRDIFLRNFELLKNNSSFRNVRTINEEDSFGDGLANVSNSSHIFDCMSLESSKYSIISGGNSRNLYDSINGWLDSEYCLETISTINITNTHFSMLTYYSRDVLYSFHIEGCQNCFGCFGLRNKQYCILNRQYSKDEYESLVPRIIEKMMVTPLRHGFEGQMEWGEFFPASMSPFGYNETVANEYFPLTREEVLWKTSLIGEDVRRTGGVISEVNPPLSPLSGWSSNDTFLHWHHFNWSDYEAPFPKVEKVIPASKLPNEITKIPDDILNWAIECEVSGKPFRIIKQELEFYRKHNLPIPRRHPDIRHMDRMRMRNPRKLFERMCYCCGKKMLTTYAPERPERVYCEVCYESEVLA